MRRLIFHRWALIGASLLCILPAAARADNAPDLDHIRVRYYGGLLLQHVRVSTLFWGRHWSQNSLTSYFNRFFTTLFADGRYLANLAQYSAGGYSIGNGQWVGTATDVNTPLARVTDQQIRQEVGAQVAAGRLPKPDADTLYVVFTPPGVVVQFGKENSEHDFRGYHNYSFGGGAGEFAYAVIPYKDDHPVSPGNPRLMTSTISHELAEAVTDPQPYDDTLGWYDEHNGEIADIPIDLYYDDRIGDHDLWDVLQAPDGHRYLVQKVWSVRDGAPMAFYPVSPVQ